MKVIRLAVISVLCGCGSSLSAGELLRYVDLRIPEGAQLEGADAPDKPWELIVPKDFSGDLSKYWLQLGDHAENMIFFNLKLVQKHGLKVSYHVDLEPILNTTLNGLLPATDLPTATDGRMIVRASVCLTAGEVVWRVPTTLISSSGYRSFALSPTARVYFIPQSPAKALPQESGLQAVFYQVKQDGNNWAAVAGIKIVAMGSNPKQRPDDDPAYKDRKILEGPVFRSTNIGESKALAATESYGFIWAAVRIDPTWISRPPIIRPVLDDDFKELKH